MNSFSLALPDSWSTIQRRKERKNFYMYVYIWGVRLSNSQARERERKVESVLIIYLRTREHKSATDEPHHLQHNQWWVVASIWLVFSALSLFSSVWLVLFNSAWVSTSASSNRISSPSIVSSKQISTIRICTMFFCSSLDSVRSLCSFLSSRSTVQLDDSNH